MRGSIQSHVAAAAAAGRRGGAGRRREAVWRRNPGSHGGGYARFGMVSRRKCGSERKLIANEVGCLPRTQPLAVSLPKGLVENVQGTEDTARGAN